MERRQKGRRKREGRKRKETKGEERERKQGGRREKRKEVAFQLLCLPICSTYRSTPPTDLLHQRKGSRFMAWVSKMWVYV